MPYKEFILENSGVTEYIGLDIETARNYDNTKPDIVWNGTTLPFTDAFFKVVFATEVFEHVYDLEPALSEIRRVLQPAAGKPR